MLGGNSNREADRDDSPQVFATRAERTLSPLEMAGERVHGDIHVSVVKRQSTKKKQKEGHGREGKTVSTTSQITPSKGARRAESDRTTRTQKPARSRLAARSHTAPPRPSCARRADSYPAARRYRLRRRGPRPHGTATSAGSRSRVGRSESGGRRSVGVRAEGRDVPLVCGRCRAGWRPIRR